MTTPDRMIDRRPVGAALVCAVLGGAILLWAGGIRVLDPREVGHVMHGDWQIHFLGWHFFRSEPWQWPPGLITSLYEPIGTALGYTDSIPIAAFVLKPFAAWLPNPFQYLGLWFLVSFALQGFFGALVVSTWTPRPALQILGGMLFVFVPALFAKVAHPALSSHWLILWALWLNWRGPQHEWRDAVQHGALGLTSGLVHPYLAVMILGLLAALLASRLIERDARGWARPLLSFALACAAVAVGWWASGLFTLPSAQDLKAAGGLFSMNVLAVINPGARSALLPGFPLVAADQWDGYQYLGAGILLLWIVAAALAVAKRPWHTASIPLVVVLLAFTVYSVMPHVAAGRRVLFDFAGELGFAVFRATGRFFWPVEYAVTAAALGVVATGLKPKIAMTLVSVALALQVVDLHKWWLDVHRGSRTDAFFAWDMPLVSPEWRTLLPRYRHMRLYSPEFCRGPVPVATAAAAYQAGLFGVGLNDGYAARVDAARQAAACQQLRDDFARGVVDESTVYLLAPAFAAEFAARTGGIAECREIDKVTVCVRR